MTKCDIKMVNDYEIIAAFVGWYTHKSAKFTLYTCLYSIKKFFSILEMNTLHFLTENKNQAINIDTMYFTML